LVTGATGRVGRRLVPTLLADGQRVRALARTSGQARALEAQGAEAVIGDLSNARSLQRATQGMRRVVHLAAVYADQPGGTVDVLNTRGTSRLAEASLDEGVDRFVVASTSLVYGPGLGRPANEDDRRAPHVDNAYARSKVAEEDTLFEIHRTRGLPLRIVRLGFVYGDGDPHLNDAAVWADQWASHRRLHMLHHDDASRVLALALALDDIDGLAINAADDYPITAWELRHLAGRSHPAQPSEECDPWDSVVDTTRLRRDLRFRPRFPTVYCATHAGAL
jgi:nucleoside-diphosphate-sugar epimerase